MKNIPKMQGFSDLSLSQIERPEDCFSAVCVPGGAVKKIENLRGFRRFSQLPLYLYAAMLLYLLLCLCQNRTSMEMFVSPRFQLSPPLPWAPH